MIRHGLFPPDRSHHLPALTVTPLALVILMTSILCTSGTAAPKADFTVAPSDNDANPGTAGKPFATLGRARDAVRARIAAGIKSNVTVLIRGGTYELTTPLSFGPQDSGTAEYSITYAAYPGETVVISGGTRLTGWHHGEGALWTTTVPAVKAGQWYFRHLFINGRRAVRARTPNIDANPPYWQLKGAQLSKDLQTHTYEFQPGQLAQWHNLTDVEAVVFGNWATTRKRFAAVDLANNTAVMTGPNARPHDAIAPASGRWFYIENAREALDEPGEWYLNRSTGVLTYWPRPGENMTTANVVASRLTQVLELQGTPQAPIRNLHFQGLQICYADWTPPPGGYLGIQACHFATGTSWAGNPWGVMDAAVRWDYAVGCSFNRGAIAHLGGCGIALVAGCSDDQLDGNRVFDISGNGIMLGGPSDEASVPKNNRITDNDVHACGIDYAGATGIWAGFTQQTVIAHNLVHDLPYSGISLGWQWNPQPTAAKENTIAFNHIYDVMRRLGDGGGIYTLGLQPGTIIRGNWIHHVERSPFAQAAPNNGMFLDQGSKGFLFEKNVIYDTAASPVRFNQCERDWHEWRDNHIGGAFPAPGKVGQGLLCDGTGSFIEAANEQNADLPVRLEPQQLTLEAWIFLPELPSGKDSRRWIAGKNANEWVNGHYALVIDRDKPGAYLNIGGGQQNCFSAWGESGQITANAWHHLAMTYDEKTLRIFCDGREVGSTEIGKPRTPGNGPFDIGRRPDGYTYFHGTIDEVRLYDRALSATEIADQVRHPEAIAKTAPGLIHSWSFEDLGAIAADVKAITSQAGPQPRK